MLLNGSRVHIKLNGSIYFINSGAVGGRDDIIIETSELYNISEESEFRQLIDGFKLKF